MLFENAKTVVIWQLGVLWGVKFIEDEIVKGLNKKYQDMIVLG
ncbi:hypothetical protein DSAG12_03852 [Promethearchaeum syntrophicum]|uniref:Uncharacterized protein n=1 Tax=Promethearchaeum syntrophicum TaxID=2594042 RepID=A0A5B9DFW1_9ARCH|nr:hypothetical protein DSAG12_03852 [Candidatus Prometheoarchaeum syntrophicum]